MQKTYAEDRRSSSSSSSSRSRSRESGPQKAAPPPCRNAAKKKKKPRRRGGSESRGPWEAAQGRAEFFRECARACCEPPRLQHDECGAAPCLLSAGGPGRLHRLLLRSFFRALVCFCSWPVYALRFARFSESRPRPRLVNDAGQTGFSAYCKDCTSWRKKPACQRAARSAIPAEKRAGSA